MDEETIKKVQDWVGKNYRRSTEPLYAWVDVQDLLAFLKSLKEIPPPLKEEIL